MKAEEKHEAAEAAKKAEEARRLAEAKAAENARNATKREARLPGEKPKETVRSHHLVPSIFPRPQSNQSQVPFLIGRLRGAEVTASATP